jgi:hypothetical protein
MMPEEILEIYQKVDLGTSLMLCSAYAGKKGQLMGAASKMHTSMPFSCSRKSQAIPQSFQCG